MMFANPLLISSKKPYFQELLKKSLNTKMQAKYMTGRKVEGGI